MKYSIAAILLFILTSSRAQYFQFSQYNFTPHRINPAMVASSDFALLNFDYRNQSTAGGFRLSSNLLNVSYPLAARRGGRLGGIGISLMDDRSGQAGIFRTQEASLSYGVSVALASHQSLSLGIRVLYQSRRLDLDGLYTGSQYIPDRGFDGAASPGEDLGEVANNFFTFSAGLHWQRSDNNGVLLGYWDISIMDLNKPQDAFVTQFQLNPTFVGAAGFRIFRRGNLGIYPEALFTRSAANNVLNAGAIFRFDLKSAYDIEVPHLDLIAKYVVGRSAIAGVQFHNERFSVGLSYDFPFFMTNVANTSAIELGVTLKKLVIRNKRKPRPGRPAGKATSRIAAVKEKKSIDLKSEPPKKPIADSATVERSATDTLVSDQTIPVSDSLTVNANAGKVDHEPLQLEKATLYFNFKFNSASLDENAKSYLKDLADALHDNPEISITLVGHTDDVGPQKVNLILSMERAQNLKAYLLRYGVDSSRVTVEGKGMSEPLDDNRTPEGRARNRRVELTIRYAR
jgi:type IX secretion system PorP/SprF family membrane protein